MGKNVGGKDLLIVDGATGEIIDSQNLGGRYIAGDEPPYIKVYIKDALYMADMDTRLSKLMWAMLKRAEYADQENGMCIELTLFKKKAILKEIGWSSTQSIDNAIQKFIKGKILYRIDRGVYRFNPHIFGRGDWKSIDKIRMTIDYDDIRGRTFNVVVKNKLTEEEEYWAGINSESED